ncbi:MAG: N-acetyltransferase, partial [Prevotella sp.]|nr:N-acetyltransferase [Prevotella sp.]MBR3512953.1 N-acetyltransferase [Bacteroidaceae bacterium]
MITIRKVESRKALKEFISFNQRLYRGNAYAVPDFMEDTLDTFDRKKNAAFEFCEADCFLAYRDGKLVGRVAAIINHKANKTWGCRNVRFGWIDFVDDPEVSKTLLDTVAQWGRDRGMDRIVGPLGFTDMDPEGMLIDGFDQLGTMSTIYNYPYYATHMEALGFEKETDWVERKIMVPHAGHEADSQKYLRVAKMSRERYNLHVRNFKSHKEIINADGGEYIQKVFGVVNKAYAQLYGYSEMNERQIAQYANTYLQFLDMRLLCVVENEANEPVAMGVGIGSLSRALQKAHGRLWPFGWWHLLKAIYLKHAPVLDLLLVGVLPEYQNKGVNAILFEKIMPAATAMGFVWAESHPQLEDNEKSQAQWSHLDCTIHKRRRCWGKKIDE